MEEKKDLLKAFDVNQVDLDKSLNNLKELIQELKNKSQDDSLYPETSKLIEDIEEKYSKNKL